jgi:hypothetical protein
MRKRWRNGGVYGDVQDIDWQGLCMGGAVEKSRNMSELGLGLQEAGKRGSALGCGVNSRCSRRSKIVVV